MRKWILISALIAMLLAVAPAYAQGNEFKIYAAANYVSPTGSDELSIDNIVDRVEASEEAGWSIGFEGRLGKWLGLELDYLRVDQDIEQGGIKIASTSMSPLSLSANFHLIHTKILDFYFGPTISYVFWDDIKDSETGEKLSTSGEWGAGVQVGLDISLIKTVAIVTGLRYQRLELTVDQQELAINPLYAKVGIAFRF